LRLIARYSFAAACAAISLLLAACADHDHAVVISVPEQRMVVLNQGVPVAVYPVSTSKFGLGDVPGRGYTPLGEMEIARKIGAGMPPGAVLKSREPTGEVVAVDSPGRDPIVTRILWLRGLEAQNQNAYGRFIYIHGTPEERNIGRPVSYGCVRMRSRDIIALYDTVGEGARVFIEDAPLANAAQPLLAKGSTIPPPPAAAPLPQAVPVAAQNAGSGDSRLIAPAAIPR
jgi:lipoprotein-anchoring transpeptidase ErfK/SrfK